MIKRQFERNLEPKLAELPTLAELERSHIQNVLRACDDNKSLAARVLGIDRRTMYRKIKKLLEHRARG